MTHTTLRASPNCKHIPWTKSQSVGMTSQTPSFSITPLLQVTIDHLLSNYMNKYSQSLTSQIPSAFMAALHAVYFKKIQTQFMIPYRQVLACPFNITMR